MPESVPSAKSAVKSGSERISEERSRQVSANGESFDDAHDDVHVASELVRAAICYALPPGPLREQQLHGDQLPRFWPWSGKDWKPMEGEFTIEKRIRELEKAGALIAAEIDRLQRPVAVEHHKSQAQREAEKESGAKDSDDPDPTATSGDAGPPLTPAPTSVEAAAQKESEKSALSA